MVSHFVEPSAKAASRRLLGTPAKASSLILAMIGTIIKPRINEALKDSACLQMEDFRIKGPGKPYKGP
jgi:hypothetical protein